MPARWIGDVAHELGLSPFGVVKLLAIQRAYPLTGMLEESHLGLLKIKRADSKPGAVISGVRSAPVPPASLPQEAVDSREITAPIAKLDSSEEKTAILGKIAQLSILPPTKQ